MFVFPRQQSVPWDAGGLGFLQDDPGGPQDEHARVRSHRNVSVCVCVCVRACVRVCVRVNTT